MAIAPNRQDIVTAVAQRHPTEFFEAERIDVSRERAEAFIRLVAAELHQANAAFGLNGKRGNASDLSTDAVAYRNPARSDTGGVEIIDVIGGAGGPSPSPQWLDVTDDTAAAGAVGVWVDPGGIQPPGGASPHSHAYWRQRLQAVEQMYRAELFRSLAKGPGGQLDVEGVSLRLYQAIRAGWTDAQILADIRASQEWRDKHPGQAPPVPVPTTAPSFLSLPRPVFGNFLHPTEQYFPVSSWIKGEDVLRRRLSWLRANGYTVDMAMLEQDHWGDEPGRDPRWTAPGPGGAPRIRSKTAGEGEYDTHGWLNDLNELIRRITIARQEYGIEIVLSLWDQQRLRFDFGFALQETPRVLSALEPHVTAVMNSWEQDEPLSRSAMHQLDQVVARATTRPTGPHFATLRPDAGYWSRSPDVEILWWQSAGDLPLGALRADVADIVARNQAFVDVVAFEHSPSTRLGSWTHEQSRERGRACVAAGAIGSLNG